MKRNIEINDKDHLVLGGVDAVELTKEYGTPLYVMEEDKILKAMRDYKASIDKFYEGKGLICFASKAFSCKEMYRIANREGLGTDVVSAGELFTALSVDFPADKICFHGNNKTMAELNYAVESSVGRIVADNIDELKMISDIAGKNGKKQGVLLRIKPGIDAHTHSFVMTGQIDSKFGFALETGEAMEAVKQAVALPNIELLGIHCHIGSQIHEIEPFTAAARVMLGFMKAVKDETGFTLKDLNLGGGYGIRYTDDDEPIPYGTYMEHVSKVIHELSKEMGMEVPFILMEPGRSIVGEAGTTLYTVGAIKHIPNIRTYVAIDGGMFDNPRYILYQSKYDFLLANKASAEPTEKVTIAGKCCESGDLLGENVPMPVCERGDICAVLSTGAYNYSMSSNYNRNAVPPVVFVKDGKSRYVVKPQDYSDICRNDI